MSVRHKVFGTLQYQPSGGALADAWLTAWVLAHSGEIRNHVGNHHTLSSIVPPHAEGCTDQLEVEYHLQTDTEADFDVLFAEVTTAIYSPGTIAAGDCDSGWGQEQE